MRRLLVVVVAVGLLAGPAGATFPGRNGLIAAQDGFCGPRGLVCPLLLLGVTAKSPKLVGTGLHPAWSPDGKRLVMGEPHAIVIATVEGMRLTSRWALVRQTDSFRWVGFPSWSGDGRYVVYVQGEPPAFRSDIYKVRVRDGHVIRLTYAPGRSFNADPDWSPDNSTIAYTHCNPSGSRNRCALMLMDADGSHQRVLLSRPWLEVNDPKWSPDGKKLGVSLHAHFVPHWAIFDLASRKLRLHDGFAFLAWSPDGSHVLVTVAQNSCTDGLAITTESADPIRDLPVCGFSAIDWQPLH